MSPTKQPSLNLFKWEQWYHLWKRKIYVLPRRIGCVKCRKSEIPSKAKAFYNCITYDLSFSNGLQKMHEYTSLQDSLALGTFYHAFCTFYHVFAFLRRRAITITCSSVAIINLSLGRRCAAHVDQINKGLLIFIHIYLYAYKLRLNVHRWSQESALCAVKEQVKQVGELLKSWVNGCLIQNCFVGHQKGNPLLS